ncbi:hypothetical protein ACO34A_16855 [Rhizobium sp. ACO-34A]|nr:hypothetical protein [Rhizobium sp. ACO-34A]ATN35474.1 hypothetical protein ACO34A_16855 [Rhizobium sp. ACO-34A]
MTMVMDAALAVKERACGSCTLCCYLPDIDELDKPANTFCRHCIVGNGCSSYETRPATCRDFLCAWMSNPLLDDAWEPSRCHMMVYRQGKQITVLVDPEYPEAWLREPYRDSLHRWAREARADGGYVIVYAGEALSVIEAD